MTTINYAVIEEDGAINSVYSSPYIFVRCADNVSDLTHYCDVSNYEIKKKKEYEYTIEKDGLNISITGLPQNVQIVANGHFIITDDEPTEIEFDVAGSYEIAMSAHVEYLDKTFDVDVSDESVDEVEQGDDGVNDGEA